MRNTWFLVLQISETGKVLDGRGTFGPDGHIVSLTALITPHPQCRPESLELHTSFIDGVHLYSSFAPAFLAVRNYLTSVEVPTRILIEHSLLIITCKT